ncbi:MAG: hypothetical protein ACOCZK_01430 [Planctomycetota bacterium]
MIAQQEYQPLVFTTVYAKGRPTAYESFRVSFERGGVIECATEAQIRAATEAHLARARKHRVHDHVVTAERIVRPAL